MACSSVEQVKVSESQIIKIWRYQLLKETELVTEDGQPIRIIYPGRSNDDCGADFRDAVIALGGRVIKGNIEVHVKSSGWQAHQHHRDPIYNRVILHVVMWRDTGAVINLQNGVSIPTLVLNKYTKISASQLPDWACSSATLGRNGEGMGKDPSLSLLSLPCFKATKDLTGDIMAESLDRAGEERFWAKARRFQVDLTQTEAKQCFYQGIMGALGYSKNKTPFLELAHRVPLQVLESITGGKIAEEECLARLEALLLGTAGLLPSQRPSCCPGDKSGNEWVDKLERLWTFCNQPEVMSPDAWHLFKIRPNNFPTRRIAAMSHLMLRYREGGIFDEIINTLKEIPPNKSHHILEKGLTVTTKGYWASHFDFGLGSRTKNPTLLGTSRAANIVVNVVFPFISAWSQLDSQPELEKKALDLYRSYPRLAANAVERHMKNQLRLDSSLVNSAQRQQGLIHIYNTLCTQGRCNCCPLGETA